MRRSAAISGTGSGVGPLISAFSGLRRFGLRALLPHCHSLRGSVRQQCVLQARRKGPWVLRDKAFGPDR
jgi:hypothetical protein